MSVPVLEAIADAIMRFEGWEPGSRSYRNRNPGNLRESVYGTGKDADGYVIFGSVLDGYFALLVDLRDKLSGKTSTELGKYSTLLYFFQVYAPSADHNQPQRYATFVADWLCRVYLRGDIYSSWDFSDIFAAVGQELPSVVTRS